MTANAYIRPNLAVFIKKHDPARSCFQLWPKMGEEGDKILKKKTGEALAQTIFSAQKATKS